MSHSDMDKQILPHWSNIITLLCKNPVPSLSEKRFYSLQDVIGTINRFASSLFLSLTEPHFFLALLFPGLGITIFMYVRMTSEMKVAPPVGIILYLRPHLLKVHCWSGANKISGTQSPISRRILQQLFSRRSFNSFSFSPVRPFSSPRWRDWCEPALLMSRTGNYN